MKSRRKIKVSDTAILLFTYVDHKDFMIKKLIADWHELMILQQTD